MADSPTVTLAINGRQTTVARGTLLVEAAAGAGIEIPVFCYHPRLAPVGACRMCLVEIEKSPRLQTACTTVVAEGMVVSTDSARAAEGQAAVLELLLANHPLDCPVCDKGGECPLQDNAFRFGGATSRMVDDKRHLEKALPLSEQIVLDRERCIMCLRCTRFHQEIAGDEALAVLDRGDHSVIGIPPGQLMDSPFSGNTVELCPVGALTSRAYRFRARPWDLRHTPSICAGCAVGCNVTLDSRDRDLLRLVARPNPEVDDGWLCDRGRYATLPHLHKAAPDSRPQAPLLRDRDSYTPVALEVATARAAEWMRNGRLAVLASASLTNEAVFQIAGPLRAAFPSASIGFTPDCSRAWPMRGRLRDVAAATRLLLVGIDPWTELPVLALWIRKAVRRGARLVVLDEHNGLHRDTAEWLRASRSELGAPLRELCAALAGAPASDATRRAAMLLAGEGPAVVMAGLGVARDPELHALLQQLEASLGSGAGFWGAPPLAANGRGVQELGAELADPQLVDSEGLLLGAPDTLLVVGAPVPRVAEGTRVVLAAHSWPQDGAAADVVLPMLHPYEQAGSITNLEGRIQHLAPGVVPRTHALADFELLGALLHAAGSTAPRELAQVRRALSLAHPSFASALSGPATAVGTSRVTPIHHDVP